MPRPDTQTQPAPAVQETRPRSQILAVVGTDTEVGKSIVTASLARSLKQLGISVGVFKPFASDPARRQSGDAFSTDADLLARAAELPGGDAEATGQHFSAPLAPLAAADLEGRRVDLNAALRQARAMAKRYELTLVEGCGGWEVPLTSKRTTADFFQMLGAPVLIVARAGLGTINHSLLTLRAVEARELRVFGIVLNRVQGGKAGLSEQSNPKYLSHFARVRVWGPLPYRRRLNNKRLDRVPTESLHDMRSIAEDLLIKLQYS